jgi:hypothetical protein
MRAKFGRRAWIVGGTVALLGGLAASVGPAALGDSPTDGQPPLMQVTQALAHSPAGQPVANVHRMAELFRGPSVKATPPPPPASSPKGGSVVGSGANVQGFPGIDLFGQENSGSGKYKNTNGGLEPPDQGLCVGNHFVIEAVNLALRVYTDRAVPATPVIPLSQFFSLSPPADVGSVFLSDPRCIFDAGSQRFILNVLEVDEPVVGVFSRAHNYVAVSKGPNPAGAWYIYSFDVTDDGLNGTPLHLTCPCLGDQPLLGSDANGVYLSDNEFSDAEVLPIAPPPPVAPLINAAFTLPDFRNGQAQVYALSKDKLIHGQLGPVVAFDSASVPVPAGSGTSAIWSSLQPAHSPPGDHSTPPAGGAEFFLSQLDFGMAQDSRVAVWALTNTASLNSASPSLQLRHAVVNTLNGATYKFPASADQKNGPNPLGQSCLPFPCGVQKITANDDRMNEVMFTNDNLWSGVNSGLPPTAPGGDPRTGIMYFEIHPQVTAHGLTATMVRDGYIEVPKESVLFPSIAAAPGGAVIAGFTLSGVDYYPSAAWAELDGLAPGQLPVVHVSGAGTVPEDGFTGYCDPAGIGPFTNVGGLCSGDASRWGDYTFSGVDEQGCIWTAAEYIRGNARRDPVAGNWATYITRISPTGCTEPSLTPSPN